MKQVFKTATDFVVEAAPEPSLLEDGVLVRVERSLISPGTETLGLASSAASPAPPPPGERPGVLDSLKKKTALAKTGLHSLATRGIGETWRSTRAYLNASGVSVPGIAPDMTRSATGYSCAGTVLARADREGLPPVGARVACAGAGIANHAEIVSVPRHLLAPVPDALSWDEAAYGTLGSIALHGVRRAEAEPGETVVVSGLGLVGLLALQLARASGLRVIGIDLDPDRIARALALGAELAFSPAEKDPVARVREATGGQGADRVLLCLATGSSEPTNQALRMCRRKGRVVVVGMTGLALEREPFFKGEVDFVISTSYGPGRYDPVYELLGNDYPIAHVRWTEQRNLEDFLRLVANRSVDVKSLTDLTCPLEDAKAAYESFATKRPRPVGVLLAFGQGPVPLARATAVAPPKTPREKTVAVIGAGAFVRAVHLPILARRGYAIASVTNRTAASASAAARALGPETRALTDWRQALLDPAVGLVLVGTRHGSHAEITAAALDAGKHVLLEKPVATTREGLALVRRARERHRELVLAVGHNRRFSRWAIELREELEKRGGPDLLTYRVNAPFVPKESWIQDAREGGGRIVGEGTHFLDLLAFLAGDPEPTLVGAAAAPPDGAVVFARDSYQAVLKTKKAVATLVYTAQGERGLAKERVEAFASGASFVLDDYRALEGPSGRKEGEPEKGFERLWEELEKAIRGEASLLPPPEVAFAMTALAFAIEERIRGL
jgi:predicted dehydrogenase/threonine dehydrogenase-like Zn-dependent dehydrogenase